MLTRLGLVVVGSLGLLGCFEEPVTGTGLEPTSGPSGTSSSSTGGDTTAADTTAADTTAADSSTGAPIDICPEYCDLVQDICVDGNSQYESGTQCEAVCASLPRGTPEDQLGNSSACRRFQAIQAMEAPDTFCKAAGPTGDGVCGALCENFCGLAMELCVDDLAQWPDIPSCIADCMQFPNDVPYDSMVVEGDSYACRTYHLAVAALDPGVHCPHIGLDSPPCM